MEIESKNGSKIRLQEASEDIDFGRGLGFNSTDTTVSRRHVSFKLHQDGTKVSFQVKGKNPIWVRESTNDDIRVYRSSERGQLKAGDSFCVSSKNPIWFHLKRIACQDEDTESNSKIKYDEAFAEISGMDRDEIDTADISVIDPVKEFNFVVLGHEFDSYPKKFIRDIRNWNWFLEEANEDSDENSEKKSRKKRKKGGKGDDDDDEVWTGESEVDAELIKKLRNDPKPKYTTRSKDKNKKVAGSSKMAKGNAKKMAMSDEEEEEDDDGDDEDDDETLGGFIIVEDEDVGEENELDDEEEEFEEDEDDE